MTAAFPLPASLVRLQSLGEAEVLEGLSAGCGLPFIAEHDAEFFKRLYHPELRRALEDLAAAGAPLARAWRGRVRRLMGDRSGAARDLKAALDLEPGLAAAHGWLGELDLKSPESASSLTRALELDETLAWAWLYRGAGRLLRRSWQGAVEDLERAVGLKPGSGLAHLLLGRAWERRGEPDHARRAFARAAQLEPNVAAAWLCLGRTGGAAGAAFERALDADPTYALITLSWHRSGDWHRHLGRLADFAFRDPERAGWYYRQEDIHYSPYHFEEYQDSLRLHKARPRAAWAAALLARATLRCPPDPGRFERGLAAAESAARLAPGSGWIRAWRALGRIKQGRLEDARADFDECLRLQPYYHRAYAWRGSLLRRLGRLPESLADLDRAVAVDEMYPFAWHERSLTRRALGDWIGGALDLDRAFRMDFRYRWVFAVGREATGAELKAGLGELDRAVSRHGGLASLWAWRGELKCQGRDYSGAACDFERAVRLDPHHAPAHALYGRCRLETGDPETAEGWLERACELDAGTAVYAGWLGEAQFAAGRRREGLKTVAGVLQARPRLWWAHQARAQMLLAVGRRRAALVSARRGVELEGRDANGRYVEALCRLELGELKAALDAVGRALLISPNMGRAYVLRARILERLGRPAAVLRDYRKVLEDFPYLFNAQEKERVGELLGSGA